MYIRSFVSLEVAGRVGADAQVRTTAKGNSMVTFSVAVEEKSQEQRSARWFDVTYFGDARLAEILRKGALVHVRGDLTIKEGRSKTFVGVTAREVNVLAFPPREAQAQQADPQERRRSAPRQARPEPRPDPVPVYDEVPPDDYISCRADPADDGVDDFEATYG